MRRSRSDNILRAGDYRAIITWDRSEDLLRVEAVGHRRNIYDRHLPPEMPVGPATAIHDRNVISRARIRPPHGQKDGPCSR